MPILTAEGPANRKVLRAVVVLLILLALYVWDRTVLAVSLPEIRSALGLTPRQTGVIASAFAGGVALMALPSGVLIRLLGFRPVMLSGGLLFSLATAYPPFARGYADLLASRVLVGLGEGMFIVSLLLYLGSISRQHKSALIGLGATVVGIASSAGPPLIHLATEATGSWRFGFYTLAALGVLMCAPLALLAPASPPDERACAAGFGAGRSLPLEQAITFWPVLVLVGVNGLAIYSVTGLLPTWARDNFGFSAGQADLALGAVGLGMLLGGTPLGLLADRVERSGYALLAASFAAISACWLMALGPGPAMALLLAVAFGAAANSLYVASIALAQESAGRDSPPLVGLVVTIFYGSAFFSGPLLLAAGLRLGHQWGALSTYVGLYSAGVLALLLWMNRRRRLTR